MPVMILKWQNKLLMHLKSKAFIVISIQCCLQSKLVRASLLLSISVAPT